MNRPKPVRKGGFNITISKIYIAGKLTCPKSFKHGSEYHDVTDLIGKLPDRTTMRYLRVSGFVHTTQFTYCLLV
jgi:hypothetical protein